MIAMTKWSGKETIPNSSVDIDIVIVGINGKSSSRSNMFYNYNVRYNICLVPIN